MVESRLETFTCPLCGFVSHHPMDARERYCVMCHVFLDDLSESFRYLFGKRTTEPPGDGLIESMPGPTLPEGDPYD